jgi:hypothetical protein
MAEVAAKTGRRVERTITISQNEIQRINIHAMMAFLQINTTLI